MHLCPAVLSAHLPGGFCRAAGVEGKVKLSVGHCREGEVWVLLLLCHQIGCWEEVLCSKNQAQESSLNSFPIVIQWDMLTRYTYCHPEKPVWYRDGTDLSLLP